MESPKPVGKRRWKLPVCLFILGMMVWLVISRWTREPRLLDRSQRISSVNGWEQEGYANYSWLSDHEVLSIRSYKNAKGAKEWRVVKFNSATRQETIYPKSDQVDYESALLESVSPDGKWLRLTEEASASVKNYFVSLDENRNARPFVKSTLWDYERLLWGARGHQILQIGVLDDSHDRLVKRDRICTIDPENPQVKREIRHSGDLSRGNVYRMSADNHLVVVIDKSDKGTWQIQKWRRNPPITMEQSWTILSPHESAGEPEIAPTGNYLAWVATSEYTPPLDTWLHRIFATYRGHTSTRAAIWVCRLDGSSLHEVGTIETSAAINSTFASDIIARLQWLPDGKRLSFVHDGALYVVKAE